jgi:hypothetical protein
VGFARRRYRCEQGEQNVASVVQLFHETRKVSVLYWKDDARAAENLWFKIESDETLQNLINRLLDSKNADLEVSARVLCRKHWLENINS